GRGKFHHERCAICRGGSARGAGSARTALGGVGGVILIIGAVALWRAVRRRVPQLVIGRHVGLPLDATGPARPCVLRARCAPPTELSSWLEIIISRGLDLSGLIGFLNQTRFGCHDFREIAGIGLRRICANRWRSASCKAARSSRS